MRLFYSRFYSSYFDQSFQFLSVINIITEKVKRETNIARYQLLVKYSRARFGVSYILVSGQ